MRRISKIVIEVGAASLLMILFLSMSGNSVQGSTETEDNVVRITASRFEFQPAEVVVRRGVPVVLELTSADRVHGFELAEFHLQAEVASGVTTKIRFVPDKAGVFPFFCNVFCGEGHEEMSGVLRVVEQ